MKEKTINNESLCNIDGYLIVKKYTKRACEKCVLEILKFHKAFVILMVI